MLDQATLKQILHYDPASGIFTRLTGPNRGGRAGHEAMSRYPYRYRRITVSGDDQSHEYYEHRLAYLYMMGSWPPEMIDHINHVGTDNRWSNLRAVTNQENQWNALLSVTNTSGYAGVHWDRATAKWRAMIRHVGAACCLGRYKRIEDAVAARVAAEHEYRGIWARGVT